MGEAKRRGTLEERRATAEPKAKQESPHRVFIRSHGVDKQEVNRASLSAIAGGGRIRLHNKV